jgi:hypothetical protein
MGDYSKAFELGVEKGRRAGRMCSAGAHACLQATARRTIRPTMGSLRQAFFTEHRLFSGLKPSAMGQRREGVWQRLLHDSYLYIWRHQDL